MKPILVFLSVAMRVGVLLAFFSPLVAPGARPQQSPGSLTGPAAGDPLEITTQYIQQNRAAWGLSDADVADQVLRDRYVTKRNGITHLYLRQRIAGIEVYQGDIAAHVGADGRIINLHNGFARNVGAQLRAANPSLSAPEAVRQAAEHLGVPVTKPLAVEKSIGGPSREAVVSPGGFSQRSIPVKLMYLPQQDGVHLVWNMNVEMNDGQHWWDLNVDAVTGKVLSKVNWTVNDSYQVYAMPLECPSDGSRTLEINSYYPVATNASPYGWHDANGVAGAEFTDTRGNNVFAQEDLDNNNTGGVRPDGGSSLVFSNAIDFALDPTNTSYQAVAIANLFYWNNILHDVHYQYGFDEPSGNFQRNNYGRGGAGNDQVQADAQDGSGLNNANFSTPVDGTSGRMQMYLFTYTSPRRDGDLDNGIIIHEYGHGVSTRLTGGPNNSSCLGGIQSGGMGEGWSDWWALVFTCKTNQTRTTARGVGTYVLGQPLTGLGIRGYRYSTDMAVNPLTYADMPTHSEVHDAGEIWCVTLWDMYWNLVDAYGFDSDLYHGTGGNNIAMQLVIDGLKLQPCNPTMLDARDAILQADNADYGGAHRTLIWQAFAKRGMGFSAYDGGDHNSTAVVAAFDMPDDLTVSPLADFASAGPAGGPFTPSSKFYTLANIGSNSLPWTASKTSAWLDLSTTAGTLAPGMSNTLTVSINANANSLLAGRYTDTVKLSNTVSHMTQTRQVTLAIDVDDFTELFSGGADANDLANTSLLFTPDGSGRFYQLCRTVAASFPTDPTGGTALTLTDDSYATVTLTGGAKVSVYNTTNATLYVGSNGYITFGSGDTAYTESLSAHFNRPRISALFDDLNPATGGTISWKQLSDRAVITYDSVPLYGATAPNSFQIELFFDGRIRITYLGIAVTDGLAGLSRGLGVPAGFVESDLSKYSLCAGAVPQLTWLGTVNTNWDTTTGNWTGDAATYTEGAFVTFKHAGITLVNSNVAIQAAGVAPGFIAITNTTAKTFTFTGGNLGGGSLAKSGTGTATFDGYLGSLTFSNGATVRGGNLFFQAAATGISAGTRTQFFGSGTITIAGGTFRFAGSAAVSGQTNVLGNNFSIASNGGTLQYSRVTGTNPKIVLVGNITFATNAALYVAANGTVSGVDANGHELSGQITLNGTNAIRRVASSSGTALSLSGNIMDGAIAGTLILSNGATTASAGRTLAIRGTANTYSGGTIICSDAQLNNFTTFFGCVDVATNSSLGTGNVTVLGGGFLRLFDNDNIAPTARLELQVDLNQPADQQTGTVWIVANVTNTVSRLVLGPDSYTTGLFTSNNYPSYITGPGAIRVSGLPIVTVAATDPVAAEWGPAPGTFQVVRTGGVAENLHVLVAISGSAGSGTDYLPPLSSPVVIPAGSGSANLTITPVADSLAEGTETATLTIQPDAAYIIGDSTNATILISDQPMDNWRRQKFGSDADNPAIAGDLADPDGDAIPNLLEYALNLDPLAVSTNGLPVAVVESNRLTLTYVRIIAPDINLFPEGTGDLTGGWLTNGITTVVLFDDGVLQTNRAVDGVTITNATSRFLRLRVTKP